MLPVERFSCAPDLLVDHALTLTTVGLDERLTEFNLTETPSAILGIIKFWRIEGDTQEVADKPFKSPFLAQDATDAADPVPDCALKRLLSKT
ncbi:Uncharacterised protein [Chlamydia trachomatis]|nr:Uncharacterised protein [Chlamydia trachomatis]